MKSAAYNYDSAAYDEDDTVAINPMQRTELNAIRDKILRIEKELVQIKKDKARLEAERVRLAAERVRLEAMEGTTGTPQVVRKTPWKLSSLTGRWGGKTIRRLSKKPSRKNKRRHTRL